MGEGRYKDAYLSAVLKEMAMRKEYIGKETIRTIYLGGGTPSRLPARDLGKMFEDIYRRFPVAEDAEITLEVNPDDMTPDYVSSLCSLPINRISMGVQSFSDADLRFLRRRHSSEQALQAVALCRAKGRFDNINIDLIYGIPGQTPARWERTLKAALRLGLPHLSAYHLTYEAGAPLYRLKEKGKVRPVEEETSLSLFTILKDHLSCAGYLHYEISNFALPGRLSRHNSAYWSGEKYLGIGASAHSYNKESRQWNIASLIPYIDGIEKGQPQTETEILTARDKYNDYILTGMRTVWGVNLPHVRQHFGEEKYGYCLRQAARYIQGGIIIQEDDRLRFTESAWFISDGIISDLLWID